MGGEVLVGPVDARLVAARRRDPGLEIVADERLRHPTQEGERIDMGADPVGQRLAEAGLGEGVVRCPQHRDEDLGGTHLPGEPVEHRHGIAGEVHEQLLAGHVGLPHGRRDAVAPFDVEVAEPAVAVAVGMMAAIFLPQQRQRHAAAAQLGVDMPPFRQRLRSRRVVAGRREQLALQRRIVELFRDRPGDADHRGAADVFPDRRAADPDRSGDHPLARPAGILQAQNFSNLPHRQSLGGHRTSFANRKRRTLPGSDCRQRSPPHPINRVAAFVRNRWPLSIGLGGRFPSESVAALPRIPHTRIRIAVLTPYHGLQSASWHCRGQGCGDAGRRAQFPDHALRAAPPRSVRAFPASSWARSGLAQRQPYRRRRWFD